MTSKSVIKLFRTVWFKLLNMCINKSHIVSTIWWAKMVDVHTLKCILLAFKLFEEHIWIIFECHLNLAGQTNSWLLHLTVTFGFWFCSVQVVWCLFAYVQYKHEKSGMRRCCGLDRKRGKRKCIVSREGLSYEDVQD